MSNEHSQWDDVVPKGATKTDLRLTRQPADTPRGRLHRLASASTRAVAEVKRMVKIDKEAMTDLRELARRGLLLLDQPNRRGQRLIWRLCNGLDRAIFVLMMVDVDTVDKLSEGLTLTLMQLEAAENANRDMAAKLKAAEQDARTARADVAQLRTLLAQAHADAAKREAAEGERSGSWNQPTRQTKLTAEQKRAIDDPDARR
jgi:hypothetical protein